MGHHAQGSSATPRVSLMWRPGLGVGRVGRPEGPWGCESSGLSLEDRRLHECLGLWPGPFHRGREMHLVSVLCQDWETWEHIASPPLSTASWLEEVEGRMVKKHGQDSSHPVWGAVTQLHGDASERV